LEKSVTHWNIRLSAGASLSRFEEDVAAGAEEVVLLTGGLRRCLLLAPLDDPFRTFGLLGFCGAEKSAAEAEAGSTAAVTCLTKSIAMDAA
jgi:hypothetical protein